MNKKFKPKLNKNPSLAQIIEAHFTPLIPCPYCGEKISDNSNYCAYCRKKLNDELKKNE